MSSPRILRYYPTVRTAHLERLTLFAPGVLVYSRNRADFDLGAAPPKTPVRRMGAARLLLHLARTRYAIVELPEPMVVRVWPQLLGIVTWIRLLDAVRRHRTELVTYCIENYPVDLKLAEYTRAPVGVARWVARRVVGTLVGRCSRIVLGTDGAEANYRGLASPRVWRRTRTRLIEALPAPALHEEVDKQGVVFLGTFEHRKGIDVVLECWPAVHAATGAHLTIVGKGPLEGVVREALDDTVTLALDPPRDEIWRVLSASRVLILPSQPARGWKEQVGLPIVEALSMGCEIVTSDETGIAGWLAAHGHAVLSPTADPSEWAEAIVTALSRPDRTPAILGSLPAMDGRVAADRALMVPEREGHDATPL